MTEAVSSCIGSLCDSHACVSMGPSDGVNPHISRVKLGERGGFDAHHLCPGADKRQHRALEWPPLAQTCQFPLLSKC